MNPVAAVVPKEPRRRRWTPRLLIKIVLGWAVLTMVFGLAHAALAAQTESKVATESWGLQVRPYAIVWTGDRMGVLGGPKGRKSFRPFGRLRWSSYTSTQGTARGVLWVDDCLPDCASGTFRSQGLTFVHVAYPTTVDHQRVFMRLYFTDHGRQITMSLFYGGHGYFGWRPSTDGDTK
jgi:hypothetical protein